MRRARDTTRDRDGEEGDPSGRAKESAASSQHESLAVTQHKTSVCTIGSKFSSRNGGLRALAASARILEAVPSRRAPAMARRIPGTVRSLMTASQPVRAAMCSPGQPQPAPTSRIRSPGPTGQERRQVLGLGHGREAVAAAL